MGFWLWVLGSGFGCIFARPSDFCGRFLPSGLNRLIEVMGDLEFSGSGDFCLKWQLGQRRA